MYTSLGFLNGDRVMILLVNEVCEIEICEISYKWGA